MCTPCPPSPSTFASLAEKAEDEPTGFGSDMEEEEEGMGFGAEFDDEDMDGFGDDTDSDFGGGDVEAEVSSFDAQFMLNLVQNHIGCTELSCSFMRIVGLCGFYAVGRNNDLRTCLFIHQLPLAHLRCGSH